MAEEEKTKVKSCGASMGNCGGGFIWFLGAIGAAIFYIQQSFTFWEGVLGILKAIIWPVFVVYHLLGFLG